MNDIASKTAYENPAFPRVLDDGTAYYGMSLRDYFAAKAMQGMFASDTPDWCLGDNGWPDRAKHCYLMADAMLEARKL